MAKMLVDYFYTCFTFSHQQTQLLDRHELSLCAMQTGSEGARETFTSTRSALRQAATRVKELCSHLAVSPTEVSVPRALLPAFSPLILAGWEGAGTADGGDLTGSVPPAAPSGASPSAGVSKQGILFVQHGLLRQWKRCWCALANGSLSIHRLPARYSADATGERGGGSNKKVAELQLTLCNVKPIRSATRFYLELRSPTEQLQLQALSASAMQAWAEAINAGVADAFGAAPAAGPHSPARAAGLERVLASGIVCADCGASSPEWGSLNLCVPLCLECAGCHRAMGTHVSKVPPLRLGDLLVPLRPPPLLILFHGPREPAALACSWPFVALRRPLSPTLPPPPHRTCAPDGPVPQVRSLVLDSWEGDLVKLFSAIQTASLPPPHLGTAAASTGPNAVWAPSVPETVRRPTRSDAADGAGPREHREVFIRLKYELREFLPPPRSVLVAPPAEDGEGVAAAEGPPPSPPPRGTDADDASGACIATSSPLTVALTHGLYEACKAEQPLQALRLLLAGAEAEGPAPPGVEETSVGGDEDMPAVPLLRYCRRHGSVMCEQLLTLHGVGVPPPTPFVEPAAGTRMEGWGSDATAAGERGSPLGLGALSGSPGGDLSVEAAAGAAAEAAAVAAERAAAVAASVDAAAREAAANMEARAAKAAAGASALWEASGLSARVSAAAAAVAAAIEPLPVEEPAVAAVIDPLVEGDPPFVSGAPESQIGQGAASGAGAAAAQPALFTSQMDVASSAPAVTAPPPAEPSLPLPAEPSLLLPAESPAAAPPPAEPSVLLPAEPAPADLSAGNPSAEPAAELLTESVSPPESPVVLPTTPPVAEPLDVPLVHSPESEQIAPEAPDGSSSDADGPAAA